MTDFDATLFGKLNVRKVHISNASQIEGNIEHGAFDSATRLSEFTIEPSAIHGEGQVSGNSFSNLRHLKTVKLGKPTSLHLICLSIYFRK